jgi:RNA polymerase sigma factor (sigma-70 family)
MGKYTADEMILEALNNGDEKTITKIYDDYREAFTAFLLRYFQTSPDKIEGIYPESFTKFYFNIKDGKLKAPLKSTLKTYLFAIGKNVFLKQHRGTYQTKVELRAEFAEDIASIEELNMYEYEESAKIVRSLLTKIGEKCNHLLSLLYIEELPSSVICEKLGVSSLGTLRKRKFDCMKKMRLLYKNLNLKT